VTDTTDQERAVDFHIVVNAREKTVHTDELSFEHVVRLAFDPVPIGPNILITVSYRNAAGPKPAGTLVRGETVTIKNETVFNVTVTDKS
jgi:hypothetical protein